MMQEKNMKTDMKESIQTEIEKEKKCQRLQ